MPRLGFLLGGFLFLTVCGCGDGLRRVPVQGKITARGKALDNASIQFLPMGGTKGEGGLGRSDVEGNYSLIGSRDGARGVVPGQYRVRVSRLVEENGTPLPPDARDADYPNSRESIPGAYVSIDGSPLMITVPEAGGTINLEIPAKILGRK